MDNHLHTLISLRITMPIHRSRPRLLIHITTAVILVIYHWTEGISVAALHPIIIIFPITVAAAAADIIIITVKRLCVLTLPYRNRARRLLLNLMVM